jgi:hypothetical protein
MNRTGLNLCYTKRIQCFYNLEYRTARCDLIIKNDCPFPFDFTYDIMNLRPLRIISATFVQNGKRETEFDRIRSSALGTAGIRCYYDTVFNTLLGKVVAQNSSARR